LQQTSLHTRPTSLAVDPVELIPEPILEANTTYEIRATLRKGARIGPGAQPVVIQFGTSDEVLPDPELETPEGRLTLVAGGETSCGPIAAFGCLAGGRSHRRVDESIMRPLTGYSFAKARPPSAAANTSCPR
jgi:hypothetical protein